LETKKFAPGLKGYRSLGREKLSHARLPDIFAPKEGMIYSLYLVYVSSIIALYTVEPFVDGVEVTTAWTDKVVHESCSNRSELVATFNSFSWPPIKNWTGVGIMTPFK
jgi:hypothetical protein